MIKIMCDRFSNDSKAKIMGMVDEFLKDQGNYKNYSEMSIKSYKYFVRSILNGNKKECKIYVAYDDFNKAMAGFEIASIMEEDNKKIGRISGMFVNEEYRGRNTTINGNSIAVTLNQCMEEWFRNNDIDISKHDVYKNNKLGRKFWSNVGYVEDYEKLKALVGTKKVEESMFLKKVIVWRI